MVSADLDDMPLFAELSADERARVAEIAREVRWEVGQEVVHEREFAFDFYAIRDGEVQVRRDGELLRVLGAGDFFGEIGTVGGRTRRRSATAVVTAPTRAVVIAGSDIRRLTEDIPALGATLARTARERAAHEHGTS